MPWRQSVRGLDWAHVSEGGRRQSRFGLKRLEIRRKREGKQGITQDCEG